MSTLQIVGLTLLLPLAALGAAGAAVVARRRRRTGRVRSEAIGLLGDLASASAEAQAEFEQALAGIGSDDGTALAERLPQIARTGRRHEQRLGSAQAGLERLAATEQPLATTAVEVARQRDRVGTLCRTAENANPAEPGVAVAAVTLAVSSVLEHERALCEELTDAKSRLETRAARLVGAERDRFTDPLTGLPNRRGFLRHAAGLGDAAPSFAVAVFEVDVPSEARGRLEPAAADAVVAVAARVVRESVRPGDFAARTGGREFAVLMPNVDPETASFIARNCRRAAKTTAVRLPGRTESFGLSWGIAASRPGAAAEDVLSEARESRSRTPSDPGRLLSGDAATGNDSRTGGVRGTAVEEVPA